MTKPRKILVILSALAIWTWVFSVRNGFSYLVLYSMAGAATGIVIGTTARAFASSKLTKASTIMSAVLGFLFLTPILALLLTGGDNTVPFLILLLSAAALAAIAGAVWGVLDRVKGSFIEWRRAESRSLTPGGIHR